MKTNHGTAETIKKNVEVELHDLIQEGKIKVIDYT
jgi:hypothetical protein